MDVIQVKRISELPRGVVHGASLRSIQEAEMWGRRNKAPTVWVFVHQQGRNGRQSVTAVRANISEVSDGD